MQDPNLPPGCTDRDIEPYNYVTCDLCGRVYDPFYRHVCWWEEDNKDEE